VLLIPYFNAGFIKTSFPFFTVQGAESDWEQGVSLPPLNNVTGV